MDAKMRQLTVEEILQWTPLRFAEETEAWDWLELLLERGVPRRQFEITRKKVMSPESAAQVMKAICRHGYVRLLQLVLSVDPAVTHLQLDSEGSRALHVAAWNQRSAAVRLLLAAGADADGRDGRGRTALHAAAARDDIECVRILLDGGADAWALDRDGKTAAQLAKDRGNLAAARGVEHLSGAMAWPLRQLIIAAEAGNVETVRRLLAAEGPAQPGHWTHLHWAAMEGTDTAVRTLLAAGMEANARDRHGNTPLHTAAARASPAEVAALVGAGAQLDAADASGCTALHYAVRTGNLGVVRLLLAEGARPEVRDAAGATPLHHAVARRAGEAAAALLQAGADSLAADAQGTTPCDVARQFGYSDMLRLLRLAP